MDKESYVEIVPFQEEHIPELVKLEEEIFSCPWSVNSFRELLLKDYCHYFVALQGGIPVGMAGMVVLAGEGDIDKVMVSESLRGKGTGGRLLAAVFERGTELGVTAYTLEVRTGNAPAIHLYEKNGFQGAGVRPGFYEKPVEDALIMWKYMDGMQ